MTKTQEQSGKQNWFAVLDKLFWLLWILLPAMFVYLIVYLLDPIPTLIPNATPEQLQCVENIPIPSRFSTPGKLMFWSGIIFLFLFYATLMFMLHRMINRFAKGQMFVENTLRSMHQLGVVLIGFPLIQNLLSAVTTFGLQVTDNVPGNYFNAIPDPGPIAVGLFLLAIKHVLQKAIVLKTENELTI
jgi:Protein of unknown function (DUF2975)